jgi:hypothetical protein
MTINTSKKFTKEEIDEIKALQTKGKNIIYQLGQVEASLIKLESQKIIFKNEFFSIQEEETKIAEKLTEKYGKGSLNMETGEFNSTE